MRKVRIALLGVLALAVAFPAAAQLRRPELSSFYVGGSLGQSKFKDGCTGLPSGAGISCDDKDTAWKLLGGYQFNPNLAAELAYTDLGKATASGGGVTADAKAKAWELVGLGIWPLGDQFGVYGKLGGYHGELKGSSNVGLSAKDTNTGWTYGLGAQWNAVRNVGLRLEWQRYHDMGGNNVGRTNVDVVSLGAIYRFQ